LLYGIIKSPEGTPGKFHDVNVLGMDFLKEIDLSMVVDTPIYRFKLLQKELTSMEADSDDEV
jgi:hypothetical protein